MYYCKIRSHRFNLYWIVFYRIMHRVAAVLRVFTLNNQIFRDQSVSRQIQPYRWLSALFDGLNTAALA